MIITITLLRKRFINFLCTFSRVGRRLQFNLASSFDWLVHRQCLLWLAITLVWLYGCLLWSMLQEWAISGTDIIDSVLPLIKALQKHRTSISCIKLLISIITNVKSSISVSPPSCLSFVLAYRDPMALRDISNSSTATGVLWEVVSSGASFSL